MTHDGYLRVSKTKNRVTESSGKTALSGCTFLICLLFMLSLGVFSYCVATVYGRVYMYISLLK